MFADETCFSACFHSCSKNSSFQGTDSGPFTFDSEGNGLEFTYDLIMAEEMGDSQANELHRPALRTQRATNNKVQWIEESRVLKQFF